MWNSPVNAAYLVFSTIVTYLIGLKLPNTNHKKLYLIIGLILNFGVLFFFKAYEPLFPFLRNIFPRLPYRSFSLPLGLSFYTFQAVSYLVDISKSEIAPEKNIADFSLYHSFFPQLMAGPIERAKNLLPQLKAPQALSYENFRRGALIFAFGLIKKLVIADRLAAISDITLKAWPNNTSFAIIFGGYPITLQYYFDFSAYSEIALGIALMMGIQLTRNFNFPFLASSPIEFWRRWHISLMTWFHDYVFMPIIELDLSFFNILIATLAVFLFAGAWHGIGLSFIIWGLLNGLFVILNMVMRLKVKKNKKINKYLNPLKVFGTFHLFVISGFFLAYNDVALSLKILSRAFTFKTFNLNTVVADVPRNDLLIVYIAVSLVFLGEIIFSQFDFWKMYKAMPAVIRWFIYLSIIVILILFSYSKARPYVYFKF